MSRVSYTIIALANSEVRRAVQELRRRGRAAAADWLEGNAAARYGEQVKDWKPFHEYTIEELIDEEAFLEQNWLVDDLDALIGSRRWVKPEEIGEPTPALWEIDIPIIAHKRLIKQNRYGRRIVQVHRHNQRCFKPTSWETRKVAH